MPGTTKRSTTMVGLQPSWSTKRLTGLSFWLFRKATNRPFSCSRFHAYTFLGHFTPGFPEAWGGIQLVGLELSFPLRPAFLDGSGALCLDWPRLWPLPGFRPCLRTRPSSGPASFCSPTSCGPSRVPAFSRKSSWFSDPGILI